ncbi:SDR family NAD(P)-dependent oxidoreductase [Actinacidiphila oryziradicis]|uniref:SDR family NAD(P)-dependent oxidoreductase n=1 Tax=Actinacidiphila oryziradicis TaxID=2571141 RepID=A0A4U0SP38_9ACTN|nr:SDR family NAD(P)-dependent oxidoreductase [Actinacidiphila oryziradicis]TKA10913.1 SDR family NAD(P)-dependent oxidoreductase [Actinacidiphila oryziradicis]
MARVLITGASDGLGLAAARSLIADGHAVTAHVRSERRADEVSDRLAGAEAVITGDLADRQETVDVARQANLLGRFDAVIHNAGIGSNEPKKITTRDGNAHVLAINALAPFLLTALIERPKRLVYVTSGMHLQGTADVRDMNWETRPWDAEQAYADSKLVMITLAFAVARIWPDVFANAMEPGWVPTKMAGYNAPDDLSLGHVTQVWLAVGGDPRAAVTGRYFYHQQEQEPLPLAHDERFQDEVLKAMEALTSVVLPR